MKYITPIRIYDHSEVARLWGHSVKKLLFIIFCVRLIVHCTFVLFSLYMRFLNILLPFMQQSPRPPLDDLCNNVKQLMDSCSYAWFNWLLIVK